MVDINKLDKISYTNEIIKMYEELNTTITKDVIKKIKEVGDLSSVTKSKLRTLAKQGGKELFKQTLLKTNKLSKRRKKEILNLFEAIIKEDIKDYKPLYEYRNKDFELTNNQIKLIETMAKLTDNEFKNLTKTIAFSSQQDFVNSLDKMYKEVITGSSDIQTSFRKTTNYLAEKGVTLKTKDGKNRSIEASVRQNIMYGVRQTAQVIENDLIKHLEADAVQVNITSNCRTTHKAINGKIFSLNKKNKEYPYLDKKYQELFEEYNCQHYKSPFIIGVSEPICTSKEIEKADNRTVKYKGKEIPYYDATQKQRALERQIRNAKKTYMSNPTRENKSYIAKMFHKYDMFTKETGLQKDYSRTYYAGYNK